jgi:hypothetical protein
MAITPGQIRGLLPVLEKYWFFLKVGIGRRKSGVIGKLVAELAVYSRGTDRARYCLQIPPHRDRNSPGLQNALAVIS